MTLLRDALLENVKDEKRVDTYYLPVADWVRQALQANGKRPYFLGISGPQGSGKSTIASALTTALPNIGITTLTFSVDDFYRTHEELETLAKAHPDNPLFQVRGFAGTHDVALGAQVLTALSSGQPIKIPTYDKSAHDGKGDRAPESKWRVVNEIANEKIDLVIFEGWMLGFHQLPEKALEAGLCASNDLLGAYEAWTKMLDAFVLLQAGDLDFITAWRVDSEQQRRNNGETTMTDADARAYIERFIPVYRDYVPELAANPPTREYLKIVLGSDRQPLTMFGTRSG